MSTKEGQPGLQREFRVPGQAPKQHRETLSQKNKKKRIFLFLFNWCICMHACLGVYHMHAMPMEAKREYQIPGTCYKKLWASQHGCCEQDPGPLQEQQELLPTGPALQSKRHVLYIKTDMQITKNLYLFSFLPLHKVHTHKEPIFKSCRARIQFSGKALTVKRTR